MELEKRICLIILEDDPAWSLPVINAIKAHLPGCTVRLEKDGKSFLRSLPDQPVPDLLILDINTPVMDGMEVLRLVRASKEHDWLPIVMYSSDASDKTRHAALMAGANGYVIKVVKDVAGTFKGIVETFAYNGEKPDRLPPLIKDTDPFGGWGSVNDLLGDI